MDTFNEADRPLEAFGLDENFENRIIELEKALNKKQLSHTGLKELFDLYNVFI
jgi:hypothetical protein